MSGTRSWVQRGRTWSSTHPLTVAAAGGALATAGIAALLGGFAPAAVADLPTLGVGEEVDTGPAEVALERVVVADEVGPQFPATDGVRYVVVTGRLTGRSDVPVPGATLEEAVVLPGLNDDLDVLLEPDSTGPADLMLLADDAPVASMGYALTEDVAWIYRSGAVDPLPEQTHVEVRGHTLREDGITREIGWFDAAAVATVSLPVERLDR